MVYLFSQVHPDSATNLNPTTRTIEVQLYDASGNLVDVSGMKKEIEFVIGRSGYKNPPAVNFQRKPYFRATNTTFCISSMRFRESDCDRPR